MSTTADTAELTSEKLREDLRAVVTDAEALLRTSATHAGEKVGDGAHAAQIRLQESLRAARERLIAAEEAVARKAREAARVTDEYVHENPWKSIGIAASLGVIFGMLISRR
jgi:ElaB/YqjD/DUF883 family membrane-anchored ribosome-binding protein